MKPFSYVMILIIALLTIVVMSLFLGKSNTTYQNLEDSQTCEKSVQVNSITRFEGFSLDTDLKCPTLFIELDETATNNKNVVFKTLSLAMIDTWNEFLQGKQEVFKTDSQNYCVIRRVIEFNGDKKYDGFFDYLVTNNPPSSSTTYYNQLTNVKVTRDITEALRRPELKQADVIDTSKPYAAVFVLGKKEHLAKITSSGVGSGVGLAVAGVTVLATGGAAIPIFVVGAVGGGAIGYLLGSDYAADWQASMLLVPYTQEDLKSLDCTKLPSKLTKLQ